MREAIRHLQANDPVLGAIIERVGEVPWRTGDPSFHALARSIVFQQLSGKAAATIFSRLAAAASDPLTPESVLAVPPERMRELGLSRQKAAYVRDLAERTVAGEVDFSHFPGLPDEEVLRQLTAVKGIGPWTVQMFLIFNLRRADVLPTGDLGIRNAIRRAYRMRALPPPKRIEKLAAKWRPYCSVACLYLWRSIDGPEVDDLW